MPNEFKDSLKGKDRVFGEDLKSARWIQRKQALIEGCYKIKEFMTKPRHVTLMSPEKRDKLRGGIGNAWENVDNTFSVQNSNTASWIVTIGISAVFAAWVGYALTECYTSMRQLVNVEEEIKTTKMNVKAEQRMKEKLVRSGKILRSDAYAAAIANLEAERKALGDKLAAGEAAKREREIAEKVRQSNLDVAIYRITIGEKPETMVVDYYNTSIFQLKGYLSYPQRLELDDLLASVLNGPKRSEIVKNSERVAFADFIELRLLGTDAKDPGRLAYYMTKEQADRLLGIVKSINPWTIKQKKDEAEKEKKQAKDEEAKKAAEKLRKENALGAVIAISGIGGAVLSAIVSGLWLYKAKGAKRPILQCTTAGAVTGAVIGGACWIFGGIPVIPLALGLGIGAFVGFMTAATVDR